MKSVFIFAGTKEGRLLTEILSEKGFECTVSVATEYGASLLPEGKNLTVLQGRMNAEQMAAAFNKKNYDFIIDSTHPFATEVSKEIKKACNSTQKKYLRLARNCASSSDDIFLFNTIDKAADWIEGECGKIFVTTGSKELAVLSSKISDKARLFVRVLPSVESLELCTKAKILQKQIIAMQGPFSEEMNEIQFSESGAKILLTKESGVAGGYFEKIEAAQKLGMKIAVIKNPETHAESCEQEQFFDSVEALLDFIGAGASSKETASGKKKLVSLIGIGTGSKNLLTDEAKKALENAEIVFGAGRMIDFAKENSSTKKAFEALYRSDEIFSYLKSNPHYKSAAVLFSGDTGFYSGAAAFFEKNQEEFEIDVIPGISSAVYFASKLQKSWQNWKMLSLHGAKCNSIEKIRRNQHCFFILSGAEDVNALGEKLAKAQENGILSGVKCFLGGNLSYKNEKVFEISYEEMKKYRSCDEKPLCVLLVENPQALKECELPALRDEDFIRGEKIPMTKQEVRALSVCELALSKSSVIYDIGSGTGSITVEAARIAEDGQVFAVDCSEGAYSLTQKNVEKFCLENVKCLYGNAAEILKDDNLPAPTHAFIGGSKGNLCEICRLLIQKNREVRIVANFVSLEGLCEMQEFLKALEKEGIERTAEIRQVAVSRAEKAGSFNLMKAQNPVWIVSF